MPSNPTTILGVDPGFADAGYAVITKGGKGISVLTYGNIKTSARQAHEKRLLKLYRETEALISRYRPELVAIEKLFFHKNVKTALDVAHARGVILLAAATSRVPLLELTPLQVKQTITGYGRADKKQIQKALQMTLGLSAIPRPDDAADALAIALTSAYYHHSLCRQSKS